MARFFEYLFSILLAGACRGNFRSSLHDVLSGRRRRRIV